MNSHKKKRKDPIVSLRIEFVMIETNKREKLEIKLKKNLGDVNQ